jgi:uncharacterized protein YcbK (DUF882 family)
MMLSEHFSLDELNKHKFDMSDEVLDNLKMLAVQLEIIRAHFNVPVIINSGYRNLDYNRNIGSKDTSQHVKGTAADIVVKDVSPDEVADAIEFLINTGMLKEGGVGRYNTFTHYDIRGTRARWNYKTL